MPTKESIYVAGQNLSNMLAGIGTRIKEDRVKNIKESIDKTYSKGKALFYDEAGKPRDSTTIQSELLQGINAYTSLGLTNEANALRDYYGQQAKIMNLDESNKYWKNTVEINTNTKFPEGDVPSGVDLSKVPIRDKGVPSFTRFQSVENGKIVEKVGTFDPSKVGQEGQDPWSFKSFPGVNVGIPSTYGETYKAGTEPDPVKPKWKSQQLINKTTGKPEFVVYDENTLTGKDGKPIDFNNYREETNEEKKGEQNLNKNPPDNAAIRGKFWDEQKQEITSLFGENEVKELSTYLAGGSTGEKFEAIKNKYPEGSAQRKLLDRLYNLRENNEYGISEKQRINDTYFKNK